MSLVKEIRLIVVKDQYYTSDIKDMFNFLKQKKSFFKKFKISDGFAQRLSVKNNISENLDINLSYLLLLIGSGIIAALGLLTNNSAVIMGSMLMAPLYWPVIGLALGIASGEKKILRKSLLLVFLSTLLVLIFSALISLLFPTPQITGEMMIRANPTLLDLVIALVTSIIGVLAIYNPNISFSAAGVALSLSILPPLSNAGIGLTSMNDKILFGSLRMYLTNIVAVVFSSSIFFYLLKFRPSNDEEKKRFGVGISSASLMLVFLSIIFSYELFQGIAKTKLINQLSRAFSDELTTMYPKIVIDDVKINVENKKYKQNVLINSTLYLPESTFITNVDQNDLTLKLAKMVSGDVEMRLNVVNTAVSELREQEKIENLLVEEYQKNVREIIAKECPNSTILNIHISSLKDDKQQLKIILLLPPDDECGDNVIDTIHDLLKNMGKEFEIEIQLIESIQI